MEHMKKLLSNNAFLGRPFRQDALDLSAQAPKSPASPANADQAPPGLRSRASSSTNTAGRVPISHLTGPSDTPEAAPQSKPAFFSGLMSMLPGSNKLPDPFAKETQVFKDNILEKLDSKSLENLNKVFEGMEEVTKNLLPQVKIAENAAREEFVQSAGKLDPKSPTVLKEIVALLDKKFPIDIGNRAQFQALKSLLTTTMQAVQEPVRGSAAKNLMKGIHDALGRIEPSRYSGAKVGELVSMDLQITRALMGRRPSESRGRPADHRRAMVDVALRHGKDSTIALMKEANKQDARNQPRPRDILADLLFKLQPPGQTQSFEAFHSALITVPEPRPTRSENAPTVLALLQIAIESDGWLSGDDMARDLVKPALATHGVDLDQQSKLKAQLKAAVSYPTRADY